MGLGKPYRKRVTALRETIVRIIENDPPGLPKIANPGVGQGYENGLDIHYFEAC